MKIGKERLRELIKEELSYLEQEARYGRNRQDADDPGEMSSRSKFKFGNDPDATLQSKIKNSVDLVVDSLTDFHNPQPLSIKRMENILGFLTDFLNENPGLEDRVGVHMMDALQQKRQRIEKYFPNKLNDFEKAKEMFMNFANDITNPASGSINESTKIKVKFRKN